jgi:4-amino-4-deoxy-L-arabinose transferase-like glycosyltransferase
VYVVECGLVALVCLCICLLIELEAGYETRKVILLGLACGCGFLMKASFPLYLVATLGLFAGNAGILVRRRAALLAFVITVSLVALPWYALNFRPALAQMELAGSVETARHHGWGDILSSSAIGNFLLALGNASPFLYLVLVVLLLASVFVVATRLHEKG